MEVLNPWLAGGSIGSKEAVLVFRTSVLSENATNLINNDLVDLEQLSSSSPNLPLISKNSAHHQSMRRLVAVDDDLHQHHRQQTKENTSDNAAEPKSNFKISPKTSCRSDMPAALMSVQYRFICTESRLLRRILHSHGIRESEDEQLYNLLWSGSHLKPDVLRNLSPYQRVNHFPR